MPTSPGLVTVDDHCPRCGNRYLLAVRVLPGLPPRATFLMAVRLPTRGERDLRAALRSIPDVTEAEVEFAVAVARQLAA